MTDDLQGENGRSLVPVWVFEKVGVAPLVVRREHVYLLSALVLQILFWYLCMPGPQLAEGYEGNFKDASTACLLTLAFFFVIPLVIVLVCGDSPGRLGIGLGDYRLGCKALLILVPVMVGGTLLGSGDAGLQDYYPISGKQINDSMPRLFAWFGMYSLFYVSFEFFYRGFLFRGPERMGLLYCFILQVVCSVLIHAGKPMTETFASIPAAFVFGWLAYRTRSILYVFVLHFLIGIANDLGVLWSGG